LQSAIWRSAFWGVYVRFRRWRRAADCHHDQWHHSGIVSQSRRRSTRTELLRLPVLPKARRPMMCRVTVIARGSAVRPGQPGALGGLVLWGVSGCGGETVFPVSGKVTYKDGTPVTDGLVIFEPVSQKSSARGEIRADGSFQLGTYKDTDGALEGDYKV